ncbi:OmpA family protein [Alphaproteobacteria bacterium]|nr:OmpA family protein [Alphaproteobacteria bacterium]
MKFLGKKNSDNDSAIWLSNSDLMAGLMIIFLFIAVGFIREKAPEIVGQQKYIMNYLSSLDIQERKIIDALENEFTEDEKKNWNLEIIHEEQLIRFNAPDVMFNLNDDELTNRYKKIINTFFPRYIRTLSGFGSIIKEIRIEGHTSSEWEGVSNETAYYKNMILSQKRTISVLNQAFNSILKAGTTRETRKWAFKKVSASGMSSRNLVLLDNGKEDPNKSRRVEFRYILLNDAKINFIKKNLQ